MKQAYIYVPSGHIFSKQDICNAVDLCLSISKTPVVLWDILDDKFQDLKKYFMGLEVITRDSPSRKTLDLLNYFDRHSLDEDILVVSIASTEKVSRYLYDRMKAKSTRIMRWNLVSSDYARFSLLERQKSLSDYIPADTELWVKELVKKFGKEKILRSLEKIKDSKTILVGESIIDEYIYCDALGRVSKDPLVAFQRRESVRQTGGVLAAARHFAGMGSLSTVLSSIGVSDLAFVSKELDAVGNIQFDFDTSLSSITKTRFVDRASSSRVFETYDLPISQNSSIFRQKIQNLLNTDNLPYFNFVVMDYGHGLISDEVVELLVQSNLEISVNTQSNAGNRGFNSISRYKGAKKAFLNGGEFQLETRNRQPDLSIAVQDLAKSLNFSEIYVTNGSRGIIAFSTEEGMYAAPALAPRIVDRVGAGDATLAVISALRAASVPIEIAAFYGNIAGALLVSSIGNELSINCEILRDEAAAIIRKVSE